MLKQPVHKCTEMLQLCFGGGRYSFSEHYIIINQQGQLAVNMTINWPMCSPSITHSDDEAMSIMRVVCIMSPIFLALQMGM
jgi:hypothetical protein